MGIDQATSSTCPNAVDTDKWQENTWEDMLVPTFQQPLAISKSNKLILPWKKAFRTECTITNVR